ncbi:phosphate-binding protein pstS 3 [Mycobacteroides abscessus subsp. abscessus]|uniref:Phosphate-binding protein n=4 Tax=Mycobacteriaceae TaxID=1762 RepID=A0A0H5RZ84_9MYCO|nr:MULTISPECIES: phosphate ABC transporter substrate-binding protein PstS [Mycobacteriaceae]NOP95075.1 phosphate ABC transporter substrate-binding protein PstS [Mycolicibacterium fortuitum]EIC71241.1 phosphate ABC transporter periplasmic-binding protein [Mycobacteroides abscessus M94]MBE5449648.1 phosphate-binding protein PstS 3 [Mycobacteroides abscessus]MBE5463977.1 phosphate-binding protein PstS 3 [Mycobacteroides abscessus]MBN7365664.1 phosphate ABC transporter substrate-binding protein Ps
MKLNRFGAALSLMAAGSLVLSACGSDNNAESGSSATKAAGEASSSGVDCAGKKSLKASGSTAQANAMTRFVNAYEQACSGYTLNYTSNGSGAGVSEFVGKQTDIGGSDSPLSKDKGEYDKAAERCGSPAWNLPVVFGPIAVTYNLEGVDGLVLDGPTAAKIFNGTIKTWDDPAIKALNPSATLPAQPITVVFRSDESGTTDNFQKYLDAASDGAWGKGAGKAFAGGVGEGAKGNEGTSAAIKNTPGSITYNEWSFAQAQGLSTAKIVTSAGPEPVEISTETVGKTISGATIKGEGNDLVLDTVSFYKPTETGAYPIVLATYEIVCSKYPDADTGQAVKAFLQSTIGAGQEGLADNGYIPLPAAFESKLSAAVNAIA